MLTEIKEQLANNNILTIHTVDHREYKVNRFVLDYKDGSVLLAFADPSSQKTVSVIFNLANITAVSFTEKDQ